MNKHGICSLIVACLLGYVSGTYADRLTPAPVAPIEPGSGPLVHWHPYTVGLFDDASKEGKLVVIYLYSHECQYSRKLSDETFSNPQFLDYLEKHFVPARANLKYASHIAKRYDVKLVPTLVVLDTHNYILGKSTGFKDAKTLRHYLDFIFVTYQYRRSQQQLTWIGERHSIMTSILSTGSLHSLPPICSVVRCVDTFSLQ